jgi:hypothetical protein
VPSEIQGVKSVHVAANTISDVASNSNSESTSVWWNHDTISPTMSILSDIGASGFRTNESSLTFTFQANEFLPDFVNTTQHNVEVYGGVLSTMTAVAGGMDDHLYTAVFTHTNDNGPKSMRIPIGSIHDAAMNSNVDASNTYEWIYDTLPPTISIDSINGPSGFQSDESWIAIIFTLSEVCDDFDETDVIITGNFALQNFTGDGLMYDAVLNFTGKQGDSETLTVQVLSDSFTDMAGNANNVSVSYQWQHGTERSSESFLESREFFATIGVTVGIVVTGSIAYMVFRSSSSISKVDNPVRSMQGTTSTKTRRPSHALDMSYDEENAISTDSADVPSDTQKLHGL